MRPAPFGTLAADAPSNRATMRRRISRAVAEARGRCVIKNGRIVFAQAPPPHSKGQTK
jgi:hypothetical protein